MRFVGLLLLLLVVAPLPSAAEDAPKPPDPKALVAAWLAVKPAGRAAAARTLRALGASTAPALRAARGKAEGATAKRVAAMLAIIQEDFERAHTPKGMIYIPAGPLEVPRASSPWGPSGTRRMVKAFYIDRTEVTVARWRRWLAVLEAQEENLPMKFGLRRPPEATDGRLPVTRVRHVGALKFARENGGRLPQSYEYERAVRGSGLSTYPWGNAMRKRCANLRDHGPGQLVPVGSYPQGASPFGVLDLVGNAAEWSATEVKQGRSGRYALFHGGSYTSAPDPALTWRGLDRMRARIGTRERQPWLGLRLVKTPPRLP